LQADFEAEQSFVEFAGASNVGDGVKNERELFDLDAHGEER
jgi:hypothetical protein